MHLEQRIAENIKRLRQAAGMSQGGLAERVHIQPESVSKIDRRKRGYNFRMLTATAGALGVSAIELMLPNLRTGSDEERITHLAAIARQLPSERLDSLMRLADMLMPDMLKANRVTWSASGVNTMSHGGDEVFLIPRHFLDRPLPVRADNPLTYLSARFGVTSFGDISSTMLRALYQQDEQLIFWRVVKHLGFRGFVFLPPQLQRYSVLRSLDDNVCFLWIADGRHAEVIDWQHLPELKHQALDYGMLTKGDAWGIPIASLLSISGGLPSEMVQAAIESQGFRVGPPSGRSTGLGAVTDTVNAMVFIAGGTRVFLPSWSREWELNSDHLPHVPALVSKLRQMGYTSLGNLPIDLDSLLAGVKGIGARSVEKFLRDLEALPERFDRERQPNNLDEAVVREAVEYLNKTPMSLDVFPGQDIVVGELRARGLGTVGDLLRYDKLFETLPAFFGVSNRQARKFGEALKERAGYLRRLDCKPCDRVVWFMGEAAVMQEQDRGFKLEHLEFWSEGSLPHELLTGAGFKTVADLPLSLSELEACAPGVTRNDIQALFEAIRMLAHPRKQSGLLDALVSMAADIAGNSFRESLAPKYQELLAYRLQKLAQGSNPTLQEMGDHIGVTRERARQMYRKILSRLVHQHLADIAHLRLDLCRFGGVASLERYCSEAALPAPSNQLVVACMAEVLQERGVRLEPAYGLLFPREGPGIEEFIKELKLFVVGQAEGLILTELDLSTLAAGFLDQRARQLVDSTAIVSLAKEVALRPTPEGKWMVPLGKARFALQVFREYAASQPGGVPIYEEARHLRARAEALAPGTFETDRSYVSALLRNDEVLLWGWGTYVHRDQLQVQAEHLQPVVQWIKDQFTGGIPQISAAAAYNAFSGVLGSLGLPNEHALYSCLRLFFGLSFYLPCSPQVFPVEQREDLSYGDIMRLYLQANGPQAYASLAEEFLGRRGWKAFQLQGALARTPGIIHTGPNAYGLVEHCPANPESLTALVKHLESMLSDDLPTISIRALYREKKATCRQLRIQNEYVLYGVLAHYFGDRLVFRRFPHVTLPHLSSADPENKSQVAAFLSACGRPALKEELQAEFVSRRGWTQRQLDNALRQEAVIPIQVGVVSEFVHLRVLDWTGEKQAQLEQLVQGVLQDVERRSMPFGSIRHDLLRDERLPALGGGVSWTEELVKAFLAGVSSVVMLGTRKTLFASYPNGAGVEDDDDFLAYILKTEFGGAEKTSVVERRLYELGFRSTTLPTVAKEDGLPYFCVGDEIHLRDL